VTEAEARDALRAFEALADVEQWIAAQRWEAIPGGWRVGESATLREQVTAERNRAEAARSELADWTAGGPVARAVRAFLNRRGRS
jgi:hypothetical protein